MSESTGSINPIGLNRNIDEENVTRIGANSRDWVDSAQDRDYWRALVNAVLNLLISWP